MFREKSDTGEGLNVGGGRGGGRGEKKGGREGEWRILWGDQGEGMRGERKGMERNEGRVTLVKGLGKGGREEMPGGYYWHGDLREEKRGREKKDEGEGRKVKVIKGF